MLRRQFYEISTGEGVEIGGGRVTLVHKSGRRARLMVESDQPTRLTRENEPARGFQRSTPAGDPPVAGYHALRPPKPQG